MNPQNLGRERDSKTTGIDPKTRGERERHTPKPMRERERDTPQNPMRETHPKTYERDTPQNL
jgi:hypothetical protein